MGPGKSTQPLTIAPCVRRLTGYNKLMTTTETTKYFENGKDKYGRTPEENKALAEGYAWAEKEGSEYWKAVFCGLKGEEAQKAAIENWILA